MDFNENDMKDTAQKIRHALRCLVMCIESLDTDPQEDFQDILMGCNSFIEAKYVLDATHFIYM